MKIPEPSTQPDVRVEIVPLIDVIFCILTFFILAAVTLTRQNAINVDLPSAATGAPQMREMLVVSVDPIGQTYIEQQPVTRDQLYQALLQYQQVNPQGLMVLYASRLASYNDVVEVLDLLRSVGGERVALATLPDGNAEAPAQNPPFSPAETLPGMNTPGFNDPLAPANPVNPANPLRSPSGDNPFAPDQPTLPGLNSPIAPNTTPQLPDLVEPEPEADTSSER
jgi:biopolymer transport protein ExbD